MSPNYQDVLQPHPPVTPQHHNQQPHLSLALQHQNWQHSHPPVTPQQQPRLPMEVQYHNQKQPHPLNTQQNQNWQQPRPFITAQHTPVGTGVRGLDDDMDQLSINPNLVSLQVKPVSVYEDNNKNNAISMCCIISCLTIVCVQLIVNVHTMSY